MSKALAKAQAKAIRGLLDAERRGLTVMSTAVQESLARAVGPLSTARNVNEALIAARVASFDIENGLRLAIATSRADARLLASTGFKAQLDAVSKLYGIAIPTPIRRTHEVDAISAETAANSYKTAWLSDVTVRLTTASRTGKFNAPKAEQETTKAQEHRVERIATTEVATAYNDEMRVQSAEVAASGAAWTTATFRRWDAKLDAKVCSICADYDGEECPLDASFRDGAEPGAVHPRCRCVSTIVTYPDQLEIVETQEARRREWINPKTGKPFQGTK